MGMPSMGNLKDSGSTSIPHLTTCLTTSDPQSFLIRTTLPIMSQHSFHLYLRTRSLRLISSSRRDPSSGMQTYQRRHRRTRARERSHGSGRAPKTMRVKHLSALSTKLMTALQVLKFMFKQDRIDFTSHLVTKEEDYDIGRFAPGEAERLLKHGKLGELWGLLDAGVVMDTN
ncbi:hypothetical protein M407DRAFT_241183 [Tulasnella calospora MUT 4182]|uniref:Uncharacterized protein n=1 Tax=Tulasnella calospora MUT 4182 TaxID=1051891 RepID=A0A0C3QKU7_9AGAM|nr:hypothetical protein M407DRAFT_241183 [Tulasnella calospora MUT 4182]